MAAQKDIYAPRPLSTSIEYPGYQFYAVLRYEGHTAGECLRYAALTVQGWLCERIRKADGGVPDAIRCAPADSFMDVPPSDLKSVRLPFSEIISLPDEGIWTLMVREPDPGIAARSYVTHVGLRAGDGDVEFGVYTDVVDRDRKLPEQDKAYRPQFVRLLFATKGMTLRQVEPLAFKEIIRVRDKRGVARLKALADSRDNQLPLVIFTHAKQPQATASEIEKLMAELMKDPAMPGPGLPPAAVGKKPTHDLPYDAEEFARHIYGFARAYIVMPEAFAELRARFNKARLNEGDILVVEPRAFGGALKVHEYRAGLNAGWYGDVTEGLTRSLQCYSKHKPYSYGAVLFADDARQLMREKELEALRASIHLEKRGEVQQVLSLLEQERRTSAEQARHINELRAQMRDEYSRGAASERQRAEELETQNSRIKAENADLKKKNEATRQAFAEFSAMKAIVDRVQSLEKMPKTNADVVAYFQRFYADRLGFTERGRKTAAKCDVNPEMLWACLFRAARVLAELYRSGVRDVDVAFKHSTGWELAPTEGSETRNNPSLMNLRKDTYEGRELSFEPHIKFPKSARKTGAQYQRLYYAYDSQTRKIIVGCVGDHLENYLSLSTH